MSFYTSLTGLNAATAMLGVTSNNISNVGTTGFKRSRADFGDIFAKKVYTAFVIMWADGRNVRRNDHVGQLPKRTGSW